MSTSDQTSDAGVDVRQSGAVAIVEIQRPPHNFFDFDLIEGIADRLEAIDADDGCRAVVLCAQGKSFCAGADFSKGRRAPAARSPNATNPLYLEAIRIFSGRKPIVVAVQGPAIGGGLGLALAGDFRVTCPEARFSANFNRLGFHPGFGLSVTLPRLVGAQQAALMLYTGRRLTGDEAVRIGLADELVPQADVRARALALAEEIAESAPRAVQSTRATLRAGLVDALRVAVARESQEQAIHYRTEDFKEGIAAAAERRPANFTGR